MKQVPREYIRVGRPDVTESTLNGFVIDGEDMVRRRIAESERATAEMLEKLAGDHSRAVRKAVAANKATPLSVLKILARDFDVDVRFSMAENNNLPESVLFILAKDENPYVSARAQAALARKAS
jgi:hypothetical protein